MDTNQSEKFLKAQKRVNDMKKFYRHLRIYIIINVLLLLVKLNLFDWFKDDYVWMQTPQFSDWASINLFGTPVLWGLGLLVHGLYVFKFRSRSWRELKPTFIKKWEKRQMDKFLREENNDGNGG